MVPNVLMSTISVLKTSRDSKYFISSGRAPEIDLPSNQTPANVILSQYSIHLTMSDVSRAPLIPKSQSVLMR